MEGRIEVTGDDVEENLSSCRMTVRKEEDTGN
jgi:hypothetical protein